MEMKAPKICLLGASFGTNNLGVGALTAGTLKAFFESFPDGELFLLDYGKRKSHNFKVNEKYPVQLFNVRFSKKFYLNNNIAFLIALALFAQCILPKIRKKVISGNFWLRRMDEADVIASMQAVIVSATYTA
jgi:hypothetical protein